MRVSVDWSDQVGPRKPTRAELASYRRWLAYLRDSRLSPAEVERRATEFAERGMEPGGQ